MKSTKKDGMLEFPHGFLWGASTSAHQVEGGNHNDWSEWEPAHAKEAAARAQAQYDRGESVWEDVDRRSTDPNVYMAGDGCDHYHRFEEDFDIAASLAMNAHRFSIEWSRIEPEDGVFDENEIEHYREVIKALRARGMEPFVTLYHWTIPLWFRDKGSWLWSQSPMRFGRFVAKLVEELGEDVRFWITLNEPEVFATNAYYLGNRPPQRQSFWEYLTAQRRLVRAHREAYRAIKRHDPKAQVGIAKDSYWFEAERSTFANRMVIRLARWWRNDWFWKRTRSTLDFMGINYYVRFLVDVRSILSPGSVMRDTGWEGAPPGLRSLLLDVAKYKKPIYITENGTIDREDTHRAYYIRSIVRNIHAAIEEGAPVKGYFHWSMLDNFEWESGYRLKFGLIEVNPPYDLKRQVRESAREYGELIRRNAVSAKEEGK